ncbi:aspartic peptidase domain-containing protein, partial [Mycena pura]
GVTYLASVGVGSPATYYNLLIDTGSSNTWIKNDNGQYKPTSTSKARIYPSFTSNSYQVTYGSGNCKGTEYTDQVTMSPQLVIKDQSIGVATEANDMNGMDGILGIGPRALTRGMRTPSNADGIPTITDNMLRQKLISQECLGIYYEPTTGANAPNGCLSFGGPDSSKYIKDTLNYVPITKISPACNYWGLEQSISYGGQEVMPSCAGIADTGTTLLMLPNKAMDAYQQMTGAVMDPTCGLLTVTEEQYNNMDSLMFNIGGVQYELTKNAQIWPRCMNSMLGLPPNKIALIFASMGDIGDSDGLCFINGFAWLQRFYSVYDSTNCKLGFATTKDTMATTN